MRPVILIPARLASTRLPGKPLADIAGKPMIVRVAERAAAANVGPVVIATDSDDIALAVQAAGFQAVMTGGAHQSGSDRIFEALTLLDPNGDFDTIVNLQGDLPTIEPETIRAVLSPLLEPACDIATVAVPFEGGADAQDPSVVKLVGSAVAQDRLRALYFTRATAPTGQGPLFHHVGIYAYRRAALERFVALGPSALERRESLEQLRALEAGLRIDAAIVDAVPLGVDTAAQLEDARAFYLPDARTNRISFQGEPGANSDTACRNMYPGMEPLPCDTFEEAFAAVTRGEADLAMIPIENTIAGRVADIHHLLPVSGLRIVGEYFLPIRFQLMAKPGTRAEDIREVYSHIHALGQCRGILRRNGWRGIVAADTAGAARMVSQMPETHVAALAPKLAAELYGLEILAQNVEDAEHNTTRFVVLSRKGDSERALWAPRRERIVTTFLFEVRNLPAALYKALGGFATNGVNMTKLESYQIGGAFTATQFYADIEGHPDERGVAHALEELAFFTKRLTILGVYPASDDRPATLPTVPGE
ncbi:3-deoxy-D-manno-octulosonate cytidylyltransferase [Aureimonas altamirensis DSM 21988]|uniref:prephenate dehydratase n=1 Tax=Aureimonas altamirensis DSM 21988 TaxID=1121026 RepID=A0ABY1IJ74_9HYPH|nr:3-deoxy-D-manno-octulosonate cytidylyltransferase [Aureimonas altamirensis DSM 21988]